MKKRILPRIFLVLLCFLMLSPLQALAVTPLDPDAEASLTLHYQKDGTAFEALQIKIYRVAAAAPDGTYTLIPPFSSYPVHIHDITTQEQWNHVATTLCAYIDANQVSPDATAQTDAEGIARFTGLQTGLYLVYGVIAENNTGTYVFNQFMIYLPTVQPDGSYLYDVEAKPKCITFVPKTKYTVLKLWQDGGNNAARPEEIIVDIYHDGVLMESQVLGPSNNWTYTWYVSGEDTGRWSVAERNVPQNYTVTIQQNTHVFTIINTCKTSPPDPPPQTGDSFAMLPWVCAMCISGVLMLILGLYGWRRRV